MRTFEIYRDGLSYTVCERLEGGQRWLGIYDNDYSWRISRFLTKAGAKRAIAAEVRPPVFPVPVEIVRA
jgi:hypothetical protein